jgi:hypothetical protein
MPEAQQVHIDAALTNLSVAYRNNDFIAELIAPQVPVRKQSDRYYIYDSDREAMRLTEDLRSPGSLAQEVDFTLSSDSYYCEDHALAGAVPDEERENADPVIQPDIDRTEYLTERILLNQEVAMELALRTASGMGETAVDSGSNWAATGSDPVADIQAARLAVFAASQRRANVMVVPYAVYETLRNNEAVVDRVKYSGGGIISTDIMAQLFDVDRVIVPKCFVNVSAKGQAAAVEPLWGTNVYLLHVAERPGLKQVTVANTFVWNGMPGSVNGTVVERWRDHGRKADMIRVQKYYDIKIIAPGAGHRITGTM